MTPWQDMWRDADRTADQPLSDRDKEAMRQVVVAAAREPSGVAPWWPRPLAIATTAMLVLLGGQTLVRPVATPPTSVPAVAESSARRQLQFSTPGGTRIIWTFNPELDLKETHR